MDNYVVHSQRIARNIPIIYKWSQQNRLILAFPIRNPIPKRLCLLNQSVTSHHAKKWPKNHQQVKIYLLLLTTEVLTQWYTCFLGVFHSKNFRLLSFVFFSFWDEDKSDCLFNLESMLRGKSSSVFIVWYQQNSEECLVCIWWPPVCENQAYF